MSTSEDRFSEKKIEELYLRYARELYWIGVALCSNETLAEDTVHEVFLYLWEHKKEFQAVSNPLPYLASMVRNRILDALKHERVVKAHEERVVYEIRSAWVSLSEERETTEEQKGRALRILGSIPERAREIFLKAVVEGLTYTAISEALGISINTVKTELRLARKKIGSQLRDKGFLWLVLIFIGIRF